MAPATGCGPADPRQDGWRDKGRHPGFETGEMVVGHCDLAAVRGFQPVDHPIVLDRIDGLQIDAGEGGHRSAIICV
jgi:hypothetical protein